MKTSRILGTCGAAALTAAALLALAPSSHAATFTYNVTLNVGTLVGNPNGPFSLDLQLVPGSANFANSVTISNFVVTGGSFTGTPTYTNGNESGSTSSSVTLSMSVGSSPFNPEEFAQAFTSSTTQISFQVQETNNQETVGSGSPIPDQFNVAILDSGLNNIATNDPSTGNTIVSNAMIGSQILSQQVATYASTGSDGNGGVTAVVAVPEPASAAMLFVGAIGLVARRKTRRSA